MKGGGEEREGGGLMRVEDMVSGYWNVLIWVGDSEGKRVYEWGGGGDMGGRCGG